MKIRAGFVSNSSSSSSSFIVIGCKMSKNDVDLEAFLKKAYDLKEENIPKEKYDREDFFWDYKTGNFEECNHLIADDSKFLDSKKEILFGKVIADIKSDGDSLDDDEIDLDKIINEVKDFMRNGGITNILNFKIHTGTRSC